MRRKNEKLSRKVDAEFEAMSKEEAEKEFDKSQTFFVPARKPQSQLISIRLPIDMIDALRDAAIQKGDIGYQQMIKIFIADGLAKSGIQWLRAAEGGQAPYRVKKKKK